MKKKFLLLSAFFVIGCGGTSGTGSTQKGFYALSLVLKTTDIQSPAVAVDNTGNDEFKITLPPDRIRGELVLRYDGSAERPMYGFVRTAQLCVLNSCYELPISGIINANDKIEFDFEISEHKVGLPWIAVNPYEDRVLGSTIKEARMNVEGTQIIYNLPPTTVAGPYLYKRYGRVVEVYEAENTKLCDNQGYSRGCQVNVSGTRVVINFNNEPPRVIAIKYSEDLVVDINPAVDARVYGGVYDGTPTPTVFGRIEAEVKLQDGITKLNTSAPVVFRVRPQ